MAALQYNRWDWSPSTLRPIVYKLRYKPHLHNIYIYIYISSPTWCVQTRLAAVEQGGLGNRQGRRWHPSRLREGAWRMSTLRRAATMLTLIILVTRRTRGVKQKIARLYIRIRRAVATALPVKLATTWTWEGSMGRRVGRRWAFIFCCCFNLSYVVYLCVRLCLCVFTILDHMCVCILT